jgi:hypothetical protein
MANTPTPRSYSTILSDMIDATLSKVGLTRVKVGGPLLSIMEAVSQSIFRATQDMFNLMDSQSIDRATGSALKSIAADEDVTPIIARPSSGFVTFSDTSFTKVSSLVYQGKPAPNAGSTTIYITDATLFPNSGQIYIGRGTNSYEGPIAYNTKTFVGAGNYWTIVVPAGTVKFHNIGETIILAQGGTRVISAGTTVRTPQGNATNAISFTTLYSAQIDDGETEVDNVEVISSTPGVIGNIPAFAIKEVSGNPYIGASATNPLPFTNGAAAEDDASLRERIKDARQSRQKGTSLAITSGIQGVISKEDNKSVVSSSLVTRSDETTLYIDDGLGYEETTSGIPQEILVESALGGEQFFQLSGQRPVAKAFVSTEFNAPFALSDNQILAVKIGGVQSEHTFMTSDFVSIGNATAYEVVASINGNPTLLYAARTTNSGMGVSIFAKVETVEDIEMSVPTIGNDANVALSFPSGIVYTLRLFKNDILLYKDGERAIVTSVPQAFWGSIVTGDTLIVQVDGTSPQTVTFVDADFVTSNTGYTLVAATNSLSAWATVFNSKVAGITAAVNSGALTLTSNAGFTARAAVSITGGTLVAKGMFTSVSSIGANNDYTLDRNTGQLKLNTALIAGDSLVVATDFMRGYIQSQDIPSASVAFLSDAHWWFVVDSGATMLNTGVNSSTSLTVSNEGNNRAKYLATNGTFGSSSIGYIQKGDWFVLWDTNFTDTGMWRVSNVDTVNWAFFEVERGTITAETKAPISGGFAFVRSAEQLQKLTITTSTPTLTSIANSFNASLLNAAATVFRGTKLRVTTNSFGSYGDVMLVTADTQAQKLKLPMGRLASNSVSHFAVVESGNKEYGTPGRWDRIGTGGTGNTFTTAGGWPTPAQEPLRSGDFMTFRKRLNDDAWNKWGANVNDHIGVESIVGTTITARSNGKTTERLPFDRFYVAAPYATTPYDLAEIVIDNDIVNNNYNINLFRNVKPKAGETYGPTFEFTDTDNSNVSLVSAFGSSTTFFNDFSLFMKARGKSHSITTHKSILWRFARYGSEGNYGRVSFTNPSGPSQSLAISTDTNDGNANINIRLPSDIAKAGLGLSGSNYFKLFCNESYSAGNLAINRAGSTVTVTVPAGFPSNDLAPGDVVYKNTSSDDFYEGPKAVVIVSDNTFTYTESGTPGNPTVGSSYSVSKRPAGTSYVATPIVVAVDTVTITATIGTHIFKVGDVIDFEPGHYQAAGPIKIAAGVKTVTAISLTTVTWIDTATTAGTITGASGVTYTVSASSCSKVSVKLFKGQCQSANISRTSDGIVTAILDSGALISLPFQVGDILYYSGGGDFPAGPKIITYKSGFTIKYVEAGAFPGTAPGATTYFSTASSNPVLTAGGTPVVAGDIVYLAIPTAVTAPEYELMGNHRVRTVTGDSFDFLFATASTGSDDPVQIQSISNMQFYPILTSASTAAAITSWVNTNANNIVSATLVKDNSNVVADGTAAIDKATIEEFYLTNNNASLNGSNTYPVSLPSFPLFDGLNFVQSTNTPTSQLTLKDAVNGELVANNDFDAETMRLSPITAKNFSDYLNSSAVSGLGQNATVSPSKDNSRLQIESLTIGSQGAVQVVGGTGNQASASVYGTGVVGTGFCKTTIPVGQINGFTGGIWVGAQASSTTNKALFLNTSTQWTVSAGNSANEWKITSTSTLVNAFQQTNIGTQHFQIEKQGNYAAYICTSGGAPAPISLSTNIQAGDWVYIVSSTMNPANVGLKRIVSVDPASLTFLVDSSGSVEETVTCAPNEYLYFLTHDSALPGDTLVIGSSVLGTSNMGSFPITRFEIVAGAMNILKVYVSGAMTATPATTLGSNYVSINIKEGQPLKLIKKILTINPSTANSGYYDVVMAPSSYGDKLLASTGTTLTALDKLAFPNIMAVGIDGYKYNTGLVAEVNKVVYGDEFNPSVYPGIIANGANINISGPLVKRIETSLSVRLRTGVNTSEMTSRIRSAVAAVINATKVGESIAISDIVSAANAIDGVLAVAMLAPIYSSLNDLIPVQANEKPLVLDLETDIQVSILT